MGYIRAVHNTPEKVVAAKAKPPTLYDTIVHRTHRGNLGDWCIVPFYSVNSTVKKIHQMGKTVFHRLLDDVTTGVLYLVVGYVQDKSGVGIVDCMTKLLTFYDDASLEDVGIFIPSIVPSVLHVVPARKHVLPVTLLRAGDGEDHRLETIYASRHKCLYVEPDSLSTPRLFLALCEVHGDVAFSPDLMLHYYSAESAALSFAVAWLTELYRFLAPYVHETNASSVLHWEAARQLPNYGNYVLYSTRFCHWAGLPGVLYTFSHTAYDTLYRDPWHGTMSAAELKFHVTSLENAPRYAQEQLPSSLPADLHATIVRDQTFGGLRQAWTSAITALQVEATEVQDTARYQAGLLRRASSDGRGMFGTRVGPGGLGSSLDGASAPKKRTRLTSEGGRASLRRRRATRAVIT